MWGIISSIIKKHHVTAQAVLDDCVPNDWSPWFTLPTASYGEVENYGPFRLKDLRMLLINPIETRRIGQRVPDKLIDHTESIMQELKDCGVAFERKDKLIVIHPID